MLFWVESALPRPKRGEGVARLICTLQEASVAAHPLPDAHPSHPLKSMPLLTFICHPLGTAPVTKYSMALGWLTGVIMWYSGSPSQDPVLCVACRGAFFVLASACKWTGDCPAHREVC